MVRESTQGIVEVGLDGTAFSFSQSFYGAAEVKFFHYKEFVFGMVGVCIVVKATVITFVKATAVDVISLCMNFGGKNDQTAQAERSLVIVLIHIPIAWRKFCPE